MGGTVDPAAADAAAATINPATAARVTHGAVSIIAARTSFGAESRSVGGGFPAVQYHGRISSSDLSNVSLTAPAGRLTVTGYFVEQPHLRSAVPLVSKVGLGGYATTFSGFILAPDPAFDRTDRRYGASIAWHWGVLDFGAGAELRDLDERSATGRTLIFGDSQFANDRLFRTASGRSLVPTAGLVWHVVPRLAVGASYKGGGSFTRTTGACVTAMPGDTACMTAISQFDRSTQRMPSTVRADASYEPLHGLVLTAAAVRRDYSRFAHDPYGILGGPVELPYRDVIEKHAGLEYRLGGIALRGGWWVDPTHFDQPLFGAADWTKKVSHRTYGAAMSVARGELAVAIDDGGTHGGRNAYVGFARSF